MSVVHLESGTQSPGIRWKPRTEVELVCWCLRHGLCRGARRVIDLGGRRFFKVLISLTVESVLPCAAPSSSNAASTLLVVAT